MKNPELTPNLFTTADDKPHRVLCRLGDGAPLRAIVIAVHGFNDHASFIEEGARNLNRHRIGVYAYDQRGFGTDPDAGHWPGKAALIDDLKVFTRLVRARHPDLPTYILGESMGGAIVMLAMTAPTAPDVDGVILSAPAVWARATQPFYQRLGLWLAAHIAPCLKLNGNTLRIQASDNIAMLRALNADPLFIQNTRADALKGIVDVMDDALAAAPRLADHALILYGARDQVIPKEPVRIMLENLPDVPSEQRTIALYPQGWHMLGRDLNADTVWRDVASWIISPTTPLPSGADATKFETFFSKSRRTIVAV
ncbi:alpha/beta hydrolase [Varunaivibrio sulfuroxidans]|uniref:Alpha-beta hydrolase superfamily lysophospholipase n=1 Tax=Varunaivibrio sulfuroxidans TaxID=1773489 RepID=A0A4R3JCJ5_9PROT|nr:alpha/beta hydrolase [Varunaivibrio sulfuroxidans]TCS63678.1 alpha-beta hydrolase superfamily lysophospholipase [Varunaivibrio sulfuroxidans]WES30187.1 lysophospholipase [Varunaivibrio sulfuroxidans]